MAARAILILVGVLLAAPARAQDAGSAAVPSVQPAPGASTIGFRGFGHFEMVSMAAKETFDAVLGSSSMRGPGGGGELTGLWKGLFVRGAVSQMSDTGERAFVFGDDIIRVGVPLTVKIRTVELGGGWRQALRQAPRLTVYGGGGVLFLNYDEASDESVALPAENASESFNGFNVFGGAEFTLWKWVFAGVEGQYRAVPDAIGAAGISQAFNETDLGGIAVRVLFGVRR